MQETPIQNNQETEVKENTKGKKAKQELISWIRELALAVIVVMIIKTFFFEIITVEGSSMVETLRSGDRLYVSILTPRIQGYERGDIVICYFPGRTDRCVKRIIGLPGDVIKVDAGTVYVNGEAAASCPLFYAVSTSPTEQPLSRWERFSRFVKLAGRNIYSF